MISNNYKILGNLRLINELKKYSIQIIKKVKTALFLLDFRNYVLNNEYKSDVNI